MRVLDTTNGLLSFWQQAVFTEAALLAHPDTRALAAPFTALLDDFQRLLGADLATRRASLQAQARTVIGDKNLDDGIRKLHSDTLSETTQDREHQVFAALFDSDIGATIRFALARQIDVAEALIDKLGLSIIPETLKGHSAKIGALVATGKEILAGRRAAARARAEANLDTKSWKEDVNAARLTVYGALLGIAAKSHRQKAWAEAFFMQSSDAPEGVDVEGETGPADGAGGATTPTA